MKEGSKISPFTAIAHTGESIQLPSKEYPYTLLYFYPHDNTPTCTVQACNLRDGYAELLAAGVYVVGVSVDSLQSHQKFAQKKNLPFPLLADEDLVLQKKFEVWKEKQLFGRNYMGTIRTSFLISSKGKIVKRIDRVSSAQHTEQILAALLELK